MTNKIKIFAPASVANIGCGFDIMGFPLHNVGDTIEIELCNKGVEISSITGCNSLSYNPDENICGIVAKAMMVKAETSKGIRINLHKGIPPGSGIGSSAASASGTAFAINKLLGKPFNDKELVEFAMIGESYASGSFHADNVAPALMGGFILIRGYDPLDIIKIESPDELYCTVILPDIEIKTKEARGLVSDNVPLKKAIKQWGNVGGLVAGLYSKDYKLIGRSVEDYIAEPYRKALIPHYDSLKNELIDSGALAVNISGSGPAIFALSKGKDSAEKSESIMNQLFSKTDINFKTYVTKIENKGCIQL